MGKITLFLLPLFFIGCEQTFDTAVDSFQNNFQVTSVSPSDSISYRADDSLATISIRFAFGSEVSGVSCDIIASDDSKLNDSPFPLFDENGDNRFSNDFPFSTFYPNGIYSIKYYVRNTDGMNQLAAIAKFKYYNGQDYVAPVLTNLVIPTTISKEVEFTFSVEVSDSNGINDILRVYYELYKPDGSQVANSDGITKFPLFDNGDTAGTGDVAAGDGIYTVKLTFPSSVESGMWRFEFTALDRGGLLSNVLIHFMEVN